MHRFALNVVFSRKSLTCRTQELYEWAACAPVDTTHRLMVKSPNSWGNAQSREVKVAVRLTHKSCTEMKRTALGLKGCALGSSYGGSGCYVGDACLSAQPQCSLGLTVMLATLANLVTCVHCCQYVWSYTCLCGHPTAHHSLPPSVAQLVKLFLAAMQSVNHVVWSCFL